MEDETEKVDKGENIDKLELIECSICGYHYQLSKKCPQCTKKQNHNIEMK